MVIIAFESARLNTPTLPLALTRLFPLYRVVGSQCAEDGRVGQLEVQTVLLKRTAERLEDCTAELLEDRTAELLEDQPRADIKLQAAPDATYTSTAHCRILPIYIYIL